MNTIAFLTNQLDVRGTCVALYDYANYYEKILNGRSVIIIPKSGNNDILAVNKFMKRFSIKYYEEKEEIDNILIENKCDILYCIKYGKNDGIYSKKIPTIIHCVFDLSEPHGDIYAAVSKTLAKKYNKKSYVPHMIGLEPSITNNNMKKQLNIPKDAIVIGRIGGRDTFNIEFVKKKIGEIVRKREDIYFIFVNTDKFDNHKQLIYLDKIISSYSKNLFISTCDIHLEAGTMGHSFGISCGEFSVNNKPIIAFNNGKLWNTAHIEILGDKGIYFKDSEELEEIILNFKKEDYEGKDWNCYRDYNPTKVMKKFKKVFIDPLNLKK